MQDNTRIKKIVMIAMASAISAVLMVLEFAIPIAPSFMKMDISEYPAIFIGFSLGPVPGIITIILKNAIKLIFKPTSTVFVGELMNVIVGSIYVGTASIIYKFSHTKKGAIISLLIAIIVTSILASIINACIIFPLYSKLYGMPMEVIIGMATMIYPFVKDYITMMIVCVLPFNLLKYSIISLIILLTYKTIKKIQIFNL